MSTVKVRKINENDKITVGMTVYDNYPVRGMIVKRIVTKLTKTLIICDGTIQFRKDGSLLCDSSHHVRLCLIDGVKMTERAKKGDIIVFMDHGNKREGVFARHDDRGHGVLVFCNSDLLGISYNNIVGIVQDPE